MRWIVLAAFLLPCFGADSTREFLETTTAAVSTVSPAVQAIALKYLGVSWAVVDKARGSEVLLGAFSVAGAMPGSVTQRVEDPGGNCGGAGGTGSV
ncbi:MAG: hypothetical protein SGI92_03760 [Bryobacteraceae bacterium]|nr:hypothetical protein [Bryobacteraceae bacterium]